MQKGSLDKQDYIWLTIFALAYIAARPLNSKLFNWFIALKELSEGEREITEYWQRTAKAKASPNSIRGGKDDGVEDISLDTTTETKISGAAVDKQGKVSNRKAKGKKGENSEVDKFIDWDDEPAHISVEGEKSDVIAWLKKWDK